MTDIVFPPYKVYIKVDDKNRIVEINSDEFMDTIEGYIYIDEGYGDKYHHAQGNYLPDTLMDERGIYRYKYIDGTITERTEEEMDGDFILVEPGPSDSERITNLETAFEALVGGIVNA